MKYLKYSLYLLVLFFTTNVYASNPITYEYVSKQQLVYEVNKVELTSTAIRIEGWGFINESQHYNKEGMLTGQLELIFPNDIKYFDLTFYEKDMTYLMKMENREACKAKEYNKSAQECYYNYKYVGWYVDIPYDKLTLKSNYAVTINLYAKESNKAYRTLLYTVLEKDRYISKDFIIDLEANLNDSRFFINHDFVMTRQNPGKNGKIYYGSKACSKQYQNILYFEPYSQYNNVLDYAIIDDVHWYQVNTNEIGCKNERLYANEKDSRALLAWVASSFIEYNGYSLKIAKYAQQTTPQLLIENPTIYVGDTAFNPDEYVSAYDSVDGKLLPVRGRTNLDINKVGRYYVEYSATNSARRKTINHMYVSVIEKEENTPPIISASNRYINQGDNYNPMLNVSAHDYEEGDISAKIEILNNIDPYLAQTQQQCFYVEDTLGLSDQKCIYVYVKPKITIKEQGNSLRFIDKRIILIDETISQNWLDNIQVLIKMFKIKNARYNNTY